MQTHGGSFSNSFSTCIGQQIQMDTPWLRSRQLKSSDIGNSTFHLEEYSTTEQFWNTLWTNSRQHKFTDIGNSIFLQVRSSIAAKLSVGFIPYSLFSLNYREQQGLKSSHPAKNHRTTKWHFHSIMARVEKDYSLSRQSQFWKILSFPFGGDNHKSPF